AVVAFAVAALILRTSKETEADLTSSTTKMESMKGKKSSVSSILIKNESVDLQQDKVDKIVFACDAGMGSSAMGASILRKKVQHEGLDLTVTNTSINNLPADADIVVTH